MANQTALKWPVLYWSLFGVVLAAALVARTAWTILLGMPFVEGDSASYLNPALQHPMFPFDTMRTISYPYLISLGLGVFSHPVGILILQTLICISSALFLHHTIRKSLNLPWIALLVFTSMLFVQKYILFEYTLLSDIFSRAAYCFFFGLLILSWNRMTWSRTVLLSAITVVGILIKPSAAIFIPFLPIYFLLRKYAHQDIAWKPYVLHTCIASLVVALPLIAYGFVYKARYGTFALTSYAGYHLFCHAGYFTDFQSPAYGQIKKELEPLISKYNEKYFRRGIYENNWLVWGSATAEMRADFGEQYPAQIVEAYAKKLPGSQPLEVKMNRIYFELATEGILAHPAAYLLYVARRGLGLLHWGQTFFHDGSSVYLPAQRHELSLSFFQNAFNHYGRVPPHFFVDYERATQSTFYRGLDSVTICLTVLFSYAFRSIQFLAAIGIVWLLLKRRPLPTNALLFWFATVLLCALYFALVAMINSAEEHRYFLTVQDIYFFSFLFGGKLFVRPGFDLR